MIIKDNINIHVKLSENIDISRKIFSNEMNKIIEKFKEWELSIDRIEFSYDGQKDYVIENKKKKEPRVSVPFGKCEVCTNCGWCD